MSITINTSEYTKTKEIEIDGHKLHIRQMSSAETINLSNLGTEIKKKKQDSDAAVKMIKEMSEMYFGLYDDKELAEKLLSPLSYDAWWEIYNKVWSE